MSSPPPPPGWYADPAGSAGTRWWDGQAWTGHVQQAAAPPPAGPAYGGPPQQHPAQQHPAQQQPGAWPRSVLLEQPVLVVAQRTKLVELTNEYAVSDGNGRQVGAVVQVGQSGLRKALRFVSQLDQYLTHHLEVRDATSPVLVLTRPAKLVRSRMLVARPDGQPVGEIVQVNAFGKIRFDLVAAGAPAGVIQAENWRASDFAISDPTGREVARVTKTWEGFARRVFTTADNYVVQVHQRLEEPLASLVLAAALTVDTALKQDDRGFN